MSYIIESLGAFNALGGVAANVRKLVADASPGAIQLKMKLSDNVKAQPRLTRYQHFNLIRFNAAFASSKDPEITRRMRKGEYDQFYKDWRAMIRNPLKKLRRGSPGEKTVKDDKRPKWSNNELNSLLWSEFKTWYTEATKGAPPPAAPPPGSTPPPPPGSPPTPPSDGDEQGAGEDEGDADADADAEAASDNTMLYVGLGGAALVVLMLALRLSKKKSA